MAIRGFWCGQGLSATVNRPRQRLNNCARLALRPPAVNTRPVLISNGLALPVIGRARKACNAANIGHIRKEHDAARAPNHRSPHTIFLLEERPSPSAQQEARRAVWPIQTSGARHRCAGGEGAFASPFDMRMALMVALFPTPRPFYSLPVPLGADCGVFYGLIFFNGRAGLGL